MQWVMAQALNELNAYLCEVDPCEFSGREWPNDARITATLCRSVAAAATEPHECAEWLTLANDYEGKIEV